MTSNTTKKQTIQTHNQLLKSILKSSRTQTDIGDWRRDGYWIIAMNNSIAKDDRLTYKGITTHVGGHNACDQCLVYIPTTNWSVSVDIGCHRYKSCSITVTYRPEYETSPYIVMATGNTGEDWSLVGGLASVRVLPTDKSLLKHPNCIMKLIGETSESYTKFGDSSYPNTVFFNVTTNLCGMTI